MQRKYPLFSRFGDQVNSVVRTGSNTILTSIGVICVTVVVTNIAKEVDLALF